jgi:hypothetical protein
LGQEIKREKKEIGALLRSQKGRYYQQEEIRGRAVFGHG